MSFSAIVLTGCFVFGLFLPLASLSSAGEDGRPRYRLTQDERDKIDLLAEEMIRPELRDAFASRYRAWRATWVDHHANTAEAASLWIPGEPGVKPPYSSDSYDYVKTRPYRELREMGPSILPLLVRNMLCEEKPYFVVRLYLQMQTNPWIRETAFFLAVDVSKAHALAKRWLDEQLRQRESLLPADRKNLKRLCSLVPEPVRKEFAWRFHNWRQCRAEELRGGGNFGGSPCDAPLLSMGGAIIPLLLERMSTVPGGWITMPVLEKLWPRPEPVSPIRTGEHRQAHVARVAKAWLAGIPGMSPPAAGPPTAAGENEQLPEEFDYFPFAREDAEEIDRQAAAIPEEEQERFARGYAVWQLFRDPYESETFNWDEVLTGGPEVDALEKMGGAAIVLLVREMVSDPESNRAMPLYKALQKERELLPHPPYADTGNALSARAAKMWLESHRSPGNYQPGRNFLGSGEGPQYYLPAGYAKKLLDKVALIPDSDKSDFDAQYRLWRIWHWKYRLSSGFAGNELRHAPGVPGIMNLDGSALPLLLERMVFDADGECAKTLLSELYPRTAQKITSGSPWLPVTLAIVKNWLDE